ncbi:protein of unknown function [Hyphomicrobium sp. MC1]|nr:protein of unknown function [Hyphomicrobium sp. MC1]
MDACASHSGSQYCGYTVIAVENALYDVRHGGMLAGSRLDFGGLAMNDDNVGEDASRLFSARSTQAEAIHRCPARPFRRRQIFHAVSSETSIVLANCQPVGDNRALSCRSMLRGPLRSTYGL